jgi:hypothetical protein
MKIKSEALQAGIRVQTAPYEILNKYNPFNKNDVNSNQEFQQKFADARVNFKHELRNNFV